MVEESNKKVTYLIGIVILVFILICISIIIIKRLAKAPYDKPTIPEGFYYVTGEWNSGYVISDSKEDENNPSGNNGNQFVWIPVKDINYFKRTVSFGDKIVEPNSGYTEPSENDTEYKEMVDSVKKYGGFYIGRYETGDADSIEPRTKATENHRAVIKRDATVYNYIACENGGNDAITIAKSMYKESTSVKSTLVYGVQWDAVMNFVKEEVDLTNSNEWGNYKDSTGNAEPKSALLQTTGASEYWVAKNIYDLAGNVGEWTMESNLESMKVVRGGAYNNNGDTNGYPVAGRYDNYPRNTNRNVGFRIALYIK